MDLSIGSVPVQPLLNVVGTLARSELNDAKIGEIVLVERVFLDDGFDLPSTFADSQDVAGAVVLLQEPDVSGHVRVNFGEVGFVDKFDDEHGFPACIRHIAA
jgi:hypothetical protein